MSKPETMMIDDVKYVRADALPATTGEIRIVILQRGWVAIGRFTQEGVNCTLTQAATIRRWGTTKGLGQLAIEGPTKDTILDKTPPMRFHELTVVATLDCREDIWSPKLT